ncbi:MAG TPA: DNA translocase FtsK, partial [Solirubrobacteraceae bacterium]|nr:DNA translocase FtsK [Solirubrobacteraceae bacterium]
MPRGLRLPRWWPPALSQVQRDVLGLGLVALAVFMAFVLYGGWNGGGAGHGLDVAAGWLVGRTRALVPLALCWGGVSLMLGGVLPDLRPLRGGIACVFASLTLALAAGTLGVSAGPAPGHSRWAASFLESHGGVAGEALYQVAHRLVQDVGVGILVVFLLLGGVLMLTGASLAGTIQAGARSLRRAAGARRALGGSPARAKAAAAENAEAFLADVRLAVPEPDAGELVLRAADPPAAQSDEPEPRVPGEGGEEPSAEANDEAEEKIPGVTYTSAEQLTPQGRLREAVTGDPSFAWKLPDPNKLLVRSTGEQLRPDTGGQAQIAASLLEALGHFGVKAKVIGSVTGPHITRYELKLAPGTKVSKVAQLKDDLAYALAATDIRILAPIPGKQAVGVEVPNAHRRIVRLGDVFQAPPADSSPLAVWLGKDVAGKVVGADLAKMPHLLVAG